MTFLYNIHLHSTTMRHSTVPAIDLEAHVARNREIIRNLPQPVEHVGTWSPSRLRYVIK
tara:strand:- start:3025 stop:3201 length:177 start_codon:yes stop_codon:yes gene_type:complete